MTLDETLRHLKAIARKIKACALVLAASLVPALAGAEVPCTIDVSMAPTPAQLVERASLIVHVRARGYCRRDDTDCRELPNSLITSTNSLGAPEPASWSSGSLGATGLIEFDVLAVLKGPDVSGKVRVPGTLIERDDFNDQNVPYTFVRRGGRSGNCFAFGYRRNGEYLVFLRAGKDSLTPYWAPLAPINEQVRSAQDPWVVWVRRQLTAK